MNKSLTETFKNQSAQCQDINLLNDSLLQCEFTRYIEDCFDSDGLISYIKLTYCIIGSPYKGVIVLFIWLLVLFVGLGVTADDFLCPALLVISRTLRLSHNIAGVTFLAFGNGAPDIFSSIAGIRQANPELVIGELYGAGIFVTTVVAGSIFILSDFKPMGRPLCRDIVFYIITTFLVWLTFLSGSIKMSHSIAFICIYIFYIITVVGCGIIYTKFLNKKKDETCDEPPKEMSGRVHKLVFARTYFGQASKARRPSFMDTIEGDNYEGVVLRRIKFRDIGVTSPQRRRTLSSIKYRNSKKKTIFSISKQEDQNDSEITETKMSRSNTISDTSFPSRSTVIGKKKQFLLLRQLSKLSLSSVWSSNTSITEVISQWREFLVNISPIDWESFKKDPWFSKLFAIFKAPIYFILTITTPVVDEQSENNNWCKILNIIHIIISPQVLIFITELSEHKQWIIEGVTLGVSVFLAIIVFFTSINEKPPVYHSAFAYFGFIISVSWIYALANEVVDLLTAVGIIFNLSHFLLGLTVLAWGNSVGDFISNLSMAKNGFPRMGISACFGGPVLNMLLGIGVPYTVLLSTTDRPVTLHYSKMVTLLYSTITLSLGSTLLIMILTRFQSKKLHGIYLICIFLSFLTIACLIEWSVI